MTTSARCCAAMILRKCGAKAASSDPSWPPAFDIK